MRTEHICVVLDSVNHDGSSPVYKLYRGTLDGVGITLAEGPEIEPLIRTHSVVYRVYLARTDGFEGFEQIKGTPQQGVQTYEEYVETMKAYKHHPSDRETWQNWQIKYHGAFKASKNAENAVVK